MVRLPADEFLIGVGARVEIEYGLAIKTPAGHRSPVSMSEAAARRLDKRGIGILVWRRKIELTTDWEAVE